jgi:N-acetylglutamate synthase
VVGQRVVVRSLVPGETGPTGGPAFTDVLGTCTSWGEVVVIDSAAGPVSLPVGLIVSGKPVPPRPSMRLRISARDAELHTARLWPTVTAEDLGEWQLRLETRPEGRLLKRANSCLAMGDPGLPVLAALDRVAEFYTARDRRPLVQVETDTSVEREALAAGWTPVGHGDAAFLLASVSQVERRLRATGAALPSGPHAEGGAAPVSRRESGDRVLAEVLDDDGVRIAGGSAVLDGDWLGIHDLAVEPARRREGLATAVVAELVGWAAEQGARTAWLHVETDDDPARALYDRLGFLEHHRCRYLTTS